MSAVVQEVQRAMDALAKYEKYRAYQRDYVKIWKAERRATDPEWVAQQRQYHRDYMRQYYWKQKAAREAARGAMATGAPGAPGAPGAAPQECPAGVASPH